MTDLLERAKALRLHGVIAHWDDAINQLLTAEQIRVNMAQLCQDKKNFETVSIKNF